MLPILSVARGLPLAPDVVLDIISFSEAVNLHGFIVKTDVAADKPDTVIAVPSEVIIGDVDLAKDSRENHFPFYPLRRYPIIVFVDFQFCAVCLCGRDHLVCPSEIGINRCFSAITDTPFRTEQARNMIIAGCNHDCADIRFHRVQHLLSVCVSRDVVFLTLFSNTLFAWIANGDEF